MVVDINLTVSIIIMILATYLVYTAWFKDGAKKHYEKTRGTFLAILGPKSLGPYVKFYRIIVTTIWLITVALFLIYLMVIL